MPALLTGGHALHQESLLRALESHGFTVSGQHVVDAAQAAGRQDWKTAQEELQLFLETLVDEIRQSPAGAAAFPIFASFDWSASLRDLRSGLSADEDWKFRWQLTLLLAELLLKRYQQHLNS